MQVFLDYDGVIVDSFDSLLQVCAEAQHAIGAGRAPTAADFRSIENLTFDELARVIGLPSATQAAFLQRVFAMQRQGWMPQPFPGVVAALSALARQHTLCVVTSSQGAIVTSALQTFGLGSAITAVSGGESGESKCTRIRNLQTMLAADGGGCCMIGDTIGDIRAGKAAGVYTAAVTWGYQPRELLAKENPDCLLEHPDELLALPGFLNQKGELP